MQMSSASYLSFGSIYNTLKTVLGPSDTHSEKAEGPLRGTGTWSWSSKAWGALSSRQGRACAEALAGSHNSSSPEQQKIEAQDTSREQKDEHSTAACDQGQQLSVSQVLPKVTEDLRDKMYVSVHHNVNTKVTSYVLCPLCIMLKIELNPKSVKQTTKCQFSISLIFFLKPAKQSENINSSELSGGSHCSKG